MTSRRAEMHAPGLMDGSGTPLLLIAMGLTRILTRESLTWMANEQAGIVIRRADDSWVFTIDFEDRQFANRILARLNGEEEQPQP